MTPQRKTRKRSDTEARLAADAGRFREENIEVLATLLARFNERIQSQMIGIVACGIQGGEALCSAAVFNPECALGEEQRRMISEDAVLMSLPFIEASDPAEGFVCVVAVLRDPLAEDGWMICVPMSYDPERQPVLANVRYFPIAPLSTTIPEQPS